MKIESSHLSGKKLLKQLLLASVCASGMIATAAQAQPIGKIFYILLENRDFTSFGDPGTSGGVPPILASPAAPYINSLLSTSSGNPAAAQTSWCTAYHNVLATVSGSNPSIHPSEPNYLWMEAGSNFGVANDNDPYGSNQQVSVIASYLAAHPGVSPQNISALIQNAGFTWRSYQEGTNLQTTTGGNINLVQGSNNLTNAVVPEAQWTVPLTSFSGTSAAYTNPYNGSHQYNFATKHNGSLFFPATNGQLAPGAINNGTFPTNPMANNYAPLEQLQIDLANGACSQYNVITPDQFNDMHTALSAGFTYNGVHYTGDTAEIAQGDNFLSKIVPMIMASADYQNNGAIVIWTDETEGTNQNNHTHTLAEIVISPLAKGNAYRSPLNYTHSSDLNTLQKIYQVTAATATGYLNDAANPSNSSGALAGTQPWYGTGTAFDLSDLFLPGVVPATIPPATNIAASGYVVNRRTNRIEQTVTVTNVLSTPIAGPINLAVDNLSTNTSLVNQTGVTANSVPTGSPYVVVAPSGLAAGASATVVLQFARPAVGDVSGNLRLCASYVGTP